LPNWCSNRVTVTGSPEGVAAVVAAVRGTDDDGNECPLDFRRIVPPPPEATDDVSWRYDHWGTKWLPVHPEIKKNDKGKFIVTFESAWSPPKEFIVALSERFPDVTVELSYDLPEEGHGRSLTYEAGVLVGEDYWENEDSDAVEL
jgi:hypothetical protein